MTAPKHRNRGVYVIGDGELARLLRLPPGQQVVAVSTSWERLAVLIMVEGDGLPAVVEGTEAPALNEWGRLRTMFPPNVSHLAPGAAHATVMASLGTVRLEEPAALLGRARVLERHGPNPNWAPWPGCSNCVNENGGDPYEWPCEDYLDAAADLVIGLPRQAEYHAAQAAAAAAALAADPACPEDFTEALALLGDPAAGVLLDRLVLGAQQPTDPEE
jgi:hypothetical protein